MASTSFLAQIFLQSVVLEKEDRKERRDMKENLGKNMVDKVIEYLTRGR